MVEPEAVGQKGQVTCTDRTVYSDLTDYYDNKFEMCELFPV